MVDDTFKCKSRKDSGGTGPLYMSFCSLPLVRPISRVSLFFRSEGLGARQFLRNWRATSTSCDESRRGQSQLGIDGISSQLRLADT